MRKSDMTIKKILAVGIGVMTIAGITGCGTGSENKEKGNGNTVMENDYAVNNSETTEDMNDTENMNGTGSINGTGNTEGTQTTEVTTAVPEDITSDMLAASYKSIEINNPISSEVFCADPTSIEYNGKLYVFGTNDQQQCDTKGEDEDNTYEYIKSLVIYSTDDMVNWTYHGIIDVKAVAPWIISSWAPSIVSRVEEDGLTHFYLYFSNNGCGVGVITTTDLLGEWEDPLGKPLIESKTPGLTNCPNPFDPGVVIDDNGDAYLTFGGGGKGYISGVSKIVKLGDDMVSLASDIATIPAPYFFEASELNYINGTYVYTYNCNWDDHTTQWDYDCDPPTMCSMVYMTSTDPLSENSWVMRGEYLCNPGLAGFDYSNNHSHLQKYQGKYYIFYHTMELRKSMGIAGGYRSLAVDEIEVDEDTLTITPIRGTKKGVTEAVKSVDAYEKQCAASLVTTAGLTIDTTDKTDPKVTSDEPYAWWAVKNVRFSGSDDEAEGATAGAEDAEGTENAEGMENAEGTEKSKIDGLKFSADFSVADGKTGFLYVYADSMEGEPLCILKSGEDSVELENGIGGVHTLYFVMSEEGTTVSEWIFTK